MTLTCVKLSPRDLSSNLCSRSPQALILMKWPSCQTLI